MQTKNNPSEGLRRFAQTYRNTLQGQLGVEKYRGTSKTVKKPVDPRFRRIRTLPQCETTVTKSETKVPSPFHPPRTVPRSLPMVSSMPSSPRQKAKSPRTRLRVPVAPDPTNLAKSESRTSAENTSAQADTLPSQAFEQPRERPPSRMSSFVERSERKRSHRTAPRTEPKAFETSDTGTFMSSNHGNCDNRVEPVNTQGNKSTQNKRCAQVPSGDYSKNLETYIAPPLEIKPTKDTSAKSDVASPQDENRCMCIACARVFQCRSGELAECECNSSNAGTKTMIRTIESMSRADFQEGDLWREPLWVTWCLNALGCFCGLLLVSCVVWVLSNRIVWDWLFPKREPPPPKLTTVQGFLNYCGTALVFSINFVAKAVYTIITLPRSSLFPSGDEDVGESRWSL